MTAGRNRLVICIFTAAFICIAAVSLLAGRYALSLGEIIDIIRGDCTDAVKSAVFLNIRLPRVLLTSLSGAALALAGWVYQSVFMNPLASPDVLGVGSGCAIGAIAAIILGADAATIKLAAFIAGTITVALTMGLARAIGRQLSVTMLLAGIAVGALANSIIMLLKYTADPERELPAIEYWLMGSFHSAAWDDIRAMLPMLGLCAAIVIILRHPIRLLAFGDDEAIALGIPAGRMRYMALCAATGLVASVVSSVGPVSWIGLIVPHMCRLIAGESRAACAQVCICGAALTTAADLIARSVTAGEVPISILTSFMGAIFLAVALIARRKDMWRAEK